MPNLTQRLIFLWAIALAGLLAIAALTASGVMAQPVRCYERAGYMKMLADKFGERPRQAGVVDGGNVVVELFASDGGSWTITLANPRTPQFICPQFTGQGWRSYPDPGARDITPPGEPS